MLCTFNCKNRKVVCFATRDVALLWLFFHLTCCVSGFVHEKTLSSEFLALAVGAMNLVEWEFLLCEWCRLRSQHCCFGSVKR